MKEWGKAYDTGYTPDISTCSPFGAKDDFRTTILPCLNVVGEMMLDPGSCVRMINSRRVVCEFEEKRENSTARAEWRYREKGRKEINQEMNWSNH